MTNQKTRLPKPDRANSMRMAKAVVRRFALTSADGLPTTIANWKAWGVAAWVVFVVAAWVLAMIGWL